MKIANLHNSETEIMTQSNPQVLSTQAKAIFLYQTKEKLNFPQSKAVLLVSVGNIMHEGAKLAAMLTLINKNFSSCDVAVCDVLQRHTIQIHDFSSVEEIYIKSKLEGEKWITRNKSLLELLKIPSKVFHWEEYFLRSNFDSCKEIVLKAYKEDETFKAAMHQTINEFIQRYERRAIIIDQKRAFDCCFNYLVEETAVMMLMWPECQYHYIVYPANMPVFLSVFHKHFVAPYWPTLLKWVTVYVRNRSKFSQTSSNPTLSK